MKKYKIKLSYGKKELFIVITPQMIKAILEGDEHKEGISDLFTRIILELTNAT